MGARIALAEKNLVRKKKNGATIGNKNIRRMRVVDMLYDLPLPQMADWLFTGLTKNNIAMAKDIRLVPKRK